MHKFAVILFVASITMLLANTGVYAQDRLNPPKLILQITVDQLRGDLPTRYYDQLSEGGFKLYQPTWVSSHLQVPREICWKRFSNSHPI